MNQLDSLSVVIAAGQTVTRMYHALDRHDPAGAARCFTPDGIWARGGNDLHGPQQIVDALGKRPATLLTRHYVTNFLVLEHVGAAAKAVFGLTVFRSDTGAPPKLPVSPAVPAMLADVECELARTDDGDWLIRRLDPVITFAA